MRKKIRWIFTAAAEDINYFIWISLLFIYIICLKTKRCPWTLSLPEIKYTILYQHAQLKFLLISFCRLLFFHCHPVARKQKVSTCQLPTASNAMTTWKRTGISGQQPNTSVSADTWHFEALRTRYCEFCPLNNADLVLFKFLWKKILSFRVILSNLFSR